MSPILTGWWPEIVVLAVALVVAVAARWYDAWLTRSLLAQLEAPRLPCPHRHLVFTRGRGMARCADCSAAVPVPELHVVFSPPEERS